MMKFYTDYGHKIIKARLKFPMNGKYRGPKPKVGDIILSDPDEPYRRFMHVHYVHDCGAMDVLCDASGIRYGLSWKNSEWLPASLKLLVKDRQLRSRGLRWRLDMNFDTGMYDLN